MVNSEEAEDSEKDEESLEIKTVKYRELIQQQSEKREDDSRDVRHGVSEEGGGRVTYILYLQVTSSHAHQGPAPVLRTEQ